MLRYASLVGIAQCKRIDKETTPEVDMISEKIA
jgi:hypothetical protein